MALEDLKLRFVDPFPHSIRRGVIFDKFSQFLKDILCLNFVTELWLNGSFVTEKPEPGDIDVVAFYDADKANRLNGSHREFLLDIELIQLKFFTDIRFVKNNDENKRSYWRGWYGFARNEKPKGFVCLNIGRLK